MPLKRRSSLFLGARNTSDVGPPVRENSTNSTASAGSTASTDPDTTIIPAANEEDERKQRQRHQKRVSIGPAGAPAIAASGAGTSSPAAPDTPSGGLGGVSGYSAAALAAHYDECMKLSAENKISAKNAFQLKMIDYMAEMLKKKGDQQGKAARAASRAGVNPLDNFQASSCALDASTKIYAHRVDLVHSDTMKLASGVGSTKEDGEGGAAGQGGEEGGDGQDPDGAKKRLKRKKKSATVEKNLANINLPKFELEFDIDPLFKKVSQQFDSGAGGGQFLSTLQIKDDTCEMLLDSTARVEWCPLIDEKEGEVEDEEKFALPEDIPLPKHKDIEDVEICPTFADFKFLGWSVEKEDADDKFNLSANSAAHNDYEGLENDEHAFDADAPCDIDAQDDDGVADGGFDGGFGVAGDDVFEANEGGNKTVGFAVKPVLSAADIITLREHLAVVPSEYSYFDHGRLNSWAGPKHWKFKPARNSAKDNEGNTEKKKKKEKEKMVFGELDDTDSLLGDMVEKSMKVPKKAIKLQSKTMENWSDERTMLPEDLHYSGKDFVRLENMADWNVVLRSGGGEKETTAVDDNDVADYDFDNLNDSQNFCPAEGLNPDDADDATGGGGEFTGVFSQTVMAPNEETTEGGEGGAMALVSAPNKVEKIQIGYAKTAKKVDMRKLKSVEWSILVEKAKETSVAENKENTETNADGSVGNATVLPGTTRFSEVYDDLRRSAQIPSKMQEGLSVPLAFVALLHLCNEQTLRLETSTDFTDLMISKG